VPGVIADRLALPACVLTTMAVDLHPNLPSLCMQEVTHPSVAQSNTVKQSNRCSRGNMECTYKLFLVHISVQMHTKPIEFAGVTILRSEQYA
jgi:hypothetical protein